MKLNWTIALMCAATLSFVACKDKNEPEDDGLDVEYSAKISVNDQSIADWDSLKAENVYVSKITPNPLYDGLHMVKVYADEVYINWMMVFDPKKYAKHRDVDVMHVYLDVDHSKKTGGFYDLFADACVDLMFEGPLYNGGAPINFAPNVYKWKGKVNGEGWEGWDDKNPIGTVKGESQFVNDSTLEVRIMIENIPGGKEQFTADGFGFGVALTQNFAESAVGFLPQADQIDGDHFGRLDMLFVKFTKTTK